jgi:hypothetical protein
MQVSQLYLDRLIDDPPSNVDNKEQETTLSNLMHVGVLAAEGLYCENPLRLEEGRNLVLSNRENLMKCNSIYELSRPRHIARELRREDLESFKSKITALVQKVGNFDTVVYVASGGAEPAFISALISGARDIVPLRYSKGKHNDTNVKLALIKPHPLNGM